MFQRLENFHLFRTQAPHFTELAICQNIAVITNFGGTYMCYAFFYIAQAAASKSMNYFNNGRRRKILTSPREAQNTQDEKPKHGTLFFLKFAVIFSQTCFLSN